VECLRTLDRLRLRAGISDEDLAIRREVVFRLTEEMVMATHDQMLTIAARASGLPVIGV